MSDSVDLDLIKSISETNPDFLIAYMKDGSKEIKNVSFDAASGMYSGVIENINIFSDSILNAIDEFEIKFLFEDVSFVPVGALFNAYKEELSCVDVVDKNEQLLLKFFLTSGAIKDLIPSSAKAYVEPYSNTGCFHDNSEEKPYFIFLNGSIVRFTTIDAALAFPFALARIKKNYLSKESRDRLDLLQGYLDSGDFDKFLEENYTSKDIIKDLGESDTFQVESKSLRDNMVKNNITVICDESISRNDGLGIIDGDMFYHLFDCAFSHYEINKSKTSDFPQENVTVGDLLFSKTYGQGVMHSISLILE